MKEWTFEETQLLIDNAEKMTTKELSELIGKTAGAIRGKKERLGLNYRCCPFTAEEQQKIRDYYYSHSNEINLDEFANSLNRPKTSICRFAKKENLTNQHRNLTNETIKKIQMSHIQKYIGEEGEQRKRKLSIQSAEWHKTHEHPKGFLHHHHTLEAKEKISVGQKIYASSLTQIEKRERVVKALKTRKEKGIDFNTTSNAYSRCKGGFRVDLKQYFRSSWEANVARILNDLGIDWEYEFKRFYFNQVDDSVASYQPDFYLPEFNKWIEVKGWMDIKSQIRLQKFAEEYPIENQNLILIDSKFYYELEAEFIFLEFWESSGHNITLKTGYDKENPRTEIDIIIENTNQEE